MIPFRHGDVLLTPIDKLPEGAVVTHNGQHILAYGEATGHAHRLTVTKPENMKVVKVGSDTYLCLLEVGTLTHEEHKTLEIVPAIYKMTFEREYSYVDEAMKKVVD